MGQFQPVACENLSPASVPFGTPLISFTTCRVSKCVIIHHGQCVVLARVINLLASSYDSHIMLGFLQSSNVN